METTTRETPPATEGWRLVVLERPRCLETGGCQRPATVQLLDPKGRFTGNFCRLHGQARLARARGAS